MHVYPVPSLVFVTVATNLGISLIFLPFTVDYHKVITGGSLITEILLPYNLYFAKSAPETRVLRI